MKKILFALMFLCLTASPLLATYPYEFTIADESQVLSDDTYSLDLMTGKIVDYLSFQAIYSTETVPAAISFTDGTRAYGNIVVSSSSYATRGSSITINSVTLAEGKDWICDINYSTQTAYNITLAISANASLHAIILSTQSAAAGGTSIVSSTAVYENINYTISATSPTNFVCTGFQGGVASDLSGVTNTITKSNAFLLGTAVKFTNHSGTDPVGITSGTVYFAIPTATTIKLASTKVLAIAGTSIDIATNTYATTGIFALTPQTISDGAVPFSFKWQVSNDKTNWYDISATSITILGSTTPTNYLWDFGFTSYRYIRAKLTSGTSGSIKLKLIGYGKRVAP